MTPYTSNDVMFRSLNDEEVEAFRKHARDQYGEMSESLKDDPATWMLWHPVTTAEFFRIREEEA